MLCWKRHFLFALVALFCSVIYGYGIWNTGLDVENNICQILREQETYGRDKAYPAALGGWTALLLSNVCLILYPWMKRWAVVSWMLMIVVVGLATSWFSPLNMIEGLFAVCCAIMAIMALMTSLSYFDACVLENIYLHSLLPTVFALPALWTGIRVLINKHCRKCLPLILSGTWFLLNLLMTIFVWRHYISLSLKEAGSLCATELQTLAGHSWSRYVIVNILIFVIAFLIDAIISWLLYRYSKHHLQQVK